MKTNKIAISINLMQYITSYQSKKLQKHSIYRIPPVYSKTQIHSKIKLTMYLRAI